MRKNLYLYKTPIYFSNIYYLLIICYKVFTNEDMHMSLNFGDKILIIKGVHQNRFTVFLVGSSIWIVII